MHIVWNTPFESENHGMGGNDILKYAERGAWAKKVERTTVLDYFFSRLPVHKHLPFVGNFWITGNTLV